MQRHQPTQLSFFLICLSLGSIAVAADKGHSCSPYVIDSGSQFVRDGIGHCVRASHWTTSDFLASCEGKSSPAMAAPTTKIMENVVNKTVTMSAGALFDTNSSEIKSDSFSELTKLKDYINNLSDIQSVNIVGHTDSSGSDEYNQSLSQRRAVAVKNYLVEAGVSPTVMSTIGLGESKPVADNSTSQGRARNRRVEINIKGDK